jgi:hypothetical protein
MTQSLELWKLDLPGDFGIKFQVPIWKDPLIAFDSSELVEWCQTNVVDTELDRKDKDPDRAMRYWYTYNAITLELPSGNPLGPTIRASVEAMRKKMGLPPAGKLYSNAWFNVMRKGDFLHTHCHGHAINTYLSGALILSPTTTSSTTFLLPQFHQMDEYGPLNIKNAQHDLMLFPHWLFHRVDPIDEDLRISVGFDVHTQAAIDYYWASVHKEGSDTSISKSVAI